MTDSVIAPPSSAAIQSARLERWMNIHKPSYELLTAIGFIDDMDIVSFGATISGLVSTDGTVAFSEAVLAHPAALAGDTVYLVSSSGSDTTEFTVHGINSIGEFTTAIVTATGTTPVAIAGTWNHIERVIHSETGGSNVGTVYVSTDNLAIPTTVGDQIQCVMLPGKNYAINPRLRVPEDRTIVLYSFDFSTDTRDALTIEINANRQGTLLQNFLFYVKDDQYHQEFKVPLRLYPNDILEVNITSSSGSAAAASFGMNGLAFVRDQEPGGVAGAMFA